MDFYITVKFDKNKNPCLYKSGVSYMKCDKCGSKNIFASLEMNQGGQFGGQRYYCLNCDNSWLPQLIKCVTCGVDLSVDDSEKKETLCPLCRDEAGYGR